MVRRAAFLGLIGLALAGSVIASEQDQEELNKQGSLASQSTTECNCSDKELERQNDLNLLGKYFREGDEVMKFVSPLLDRFQELKPLIDKLEEAEKALLHVSNHDETYEKQKTAVYRLLVQYKQESEDLKTVISIKYNKVKLEKNVELVSYYFDRCIGHINRPASSTNE